MILDMHVYENCDISNNSKRNQFRSTWNVILPRARACGTAPRMQKGIHGNLALSSLATLAIEYSTGTEQQHCGFGSWSLALAQGKVGDLACLGAARLIGESAASRAVHEIDQGTGPLGLTTAGARVKSPKSWEGRPETMSQ